MLKAMNENISLGPTIPDVPIYVTCSPEQAKRLTADTVLEGELTIMYKPPEPEKG